MTAEQRAEYDRWVASLKPQETPANAHQVAKFDRWLTAMGDRVDNTLAAAERFNMYRHLREELAGEELLALRRSLNEAFAAAGLPLPIPPEALEDAAVQA